MKKLTLKNLNWYRIFMASMMIATLAIAIWVGVSAVQKTMKLKLDFDVQPNFLCEIKMNGNTVFCNFGENAMIANGADISGNTISLNQTIYGELAAELTFDFYNYSNFKTKILLEGTDKYVILGAYTDDKAPSDTLTLDIVAGPIEFVFEEYITYTISFNNNLGGGSMQSVAVGVGERFILPPNEFKRAGHKFVGWNTKADGTGSAYANNGVISSNSSDPITLFAIWEVTYTLNLNFNSFYHPSSSNYDWASVRPILIVATTDDGFDISSKKHGYGTTDSTKRERVWTSTNKISGAEYYSYDACDNCKLYALPDITIEQCTINQAKTKNYLDTTKYDYQEATFVASATDTVTLTNLTDEHKIFLLGVVENSFCGLGIKITTSGITYDSSQIFPYWMNDCFADCSFSLPTTLADDESKEINLNIEVGRLYD